MRQLPLAYFNDTVDGTGWADVPSAYLAFGEVYTAERRRAAAQGLPTATIDNAAHLHMLIDPATVRRELENLMQLLHIHREP